MLSSMQSHPLPDPGAPDVAEDGPRDVQEALREAIQQGGMARAVAGLPQGVLAAG